jgi:hypothetical protein
MQLKSLQKKKVSSIISGLLNSKSLVEKQIEIHMKLNGICEEKIRKGEQILNGIVEEDETTTIPCSLSPKEDHAVGTHFSNSLAKSVGKLVNGYTSHIVQENYQVRLA